MPDYVIRSSASWASSNSLARWQHLRSQIKQEHVEADPFLRRPIRPEDLLLHSRAVERPIRKTVDGENVAVIRLQPLLELRKLARLRQFLGRASAQAQPDAIGF